MLITFDFDGTLSQPNIQEIAKELISEGHQIYVLTTRLDTLKRMQYKDLPSNNQVYTVCSSIGIPHCNVIFTNQQPKIYWLQNSEVVIHFENNKREIQQISQLTNVKCFDSEIKNLKQEVQEYITDLKNF